MGKRAASRAAGSEEPCGRGGGSMQNWAGSITRGNRMLLESRLENWKELGLRLWVNWVEMQALRWGTVLEICCEG